MATIDNLTKEFISAYTVDNKDEMHRLSKSIIREIKRDTYQFKKGCISHVSGTGIDDITDTPDNYIVNICLDGNVTLP